MPRNFTVLDELHKMLTAAHIEHFYIHGYGVITVSRGDHAWTVSEDCIIYWGDSADVCKARCSEFSWAADAFDYIVTAYTKAL